MSGQGIPASQIASVIPGVVAAGGTGLNLIGLALSSTARVPIGQVLSFPDPESVGAYFGLNTPEFDAAETYFNGFDGSPIKPGSILFAQYPWGAAAAPFLRGGNAGAMTLAQLKAIAPGALTVTINGVTWTSSSINLAAATSFSNAASIIQTALGANDAAFTAAIAPGTAAITASIAANVLTVSAVGSGTLYPGGVLAGAGVGSGTTIISQITGTAGGVGTYLVTGSQTVGSEAITETYGLLTVSAVSAGALQIGQIVAGAGVTVGSTITADITGSGNTGTYVTQTQTVASEAMTSGAAAVSFDSVSGGFVITGGTPGVAGTIGYASGAIATALLLTAATGAVISQGAAKATPVAFMTALFNGFQNFVSFFTLFDPVTADKVAFAQWTNDQETEVAYVEWAQEAGNAQEGSQLATAQIIALGLSGTIPFYAPESTYLDAAMVSGMIASVDTTKTNGRTNIAFLSQSGMPAEVTDGTTAEQLIANGLNFYGTYSSPSENFTWIYPGSVTGPFTWADSYYCAIWLKNILQIALLQLLKNVPNIPYNAAGYGLILEALGGGPPTAGVPAGPIQQALNFGAIRAGVPLSSDEIASVNQAAGFDIATTLQNQGWYLLLAPATPQVRAARGSPPMTLWYTDGQSVQKLNLQSLNVQ